MKTRNAVCVGLMANLLLITLLSALALAPGAQAATITVTNLASLGPGTLRQALADNQTLGGGNTIMFAGNLTGTITLAGSGLLVNSPVTILGPGTNVIAVSGNDSVQVFSVTAGPTFISDLTIRNGRAIGGAGAGGQPDGQDGTGGGIYNSAALTISNCVILSNTVVGGLGADSHAGSVGQGGNGLGGGMYNSGGSLTVISTSFEGNRALGGTGGNASGSGGSNVGAGGNAYGGAIYTLTGTIQIIGCDFGNNQTQGGTGGNGGSGGFGGGGGSGEGAAIYSESVGSIWNSTFHHGSATGGVGGTGGSGAGVNGMGSGGGIYAVLGLALNNSTIASNTASGSATDQGGGIYNSGTDSLALTNCTCAGNQADSGGGLYGSATAVNTIFAANTAATGPDVQGTITSQDFNLFQNTNGLTLTGATTHNVTGQNPLLGPLANYGGPTLTQALLPGSPAIDAGDDSVTNFLTTDQRGLPRIVGAHVDIGAVEGVYVANYTGPGLLRSTMRLGDGSVQFGFTNYPDMNLSFSVWASTNVALPFAQWSNLGAPVESPAGSGQFLFTDSGATDYPQRFYRVKGP